MEGDLDDTQENLGYQVRATDSLQTKVVPAPLRCVLFQHGPPVAGPLTPLLMCTISHHPHARSSREVGLATPELLSPPQNTSDTSVGYARDGFDLEMQLCRG